MLKNVLFIFSYLNPKINPVKEPNTINCVGFNPKALFNMVHPDFIDVNEFMNYDVRLSL